MTSRVTRILAVIFAAEISPKPRVVKVTILKYNDDQNPSG
jgi:hypothetical protein